MKTARKWAKENGWPNLGDRGRLPADALEAYKRAAPDPVLEPVPAFTLLFECPTISDEDEQAITNLLVDTLYAVFMAGFNTRDQMED